MSCATSDCCWLLGVCATAMTCSWRVAVVTLPTHDGRAPQQDAQLDGCDPLPMIIANHVQLPCLLLGNAWRGNPWKKVDFAIGKVVEVNGD